MQRVEATAGGACSDRVRVRAHPAALPHPARLGRHPVGAGQRDFNNDDWRARFSAGMPSICSLLQYSAVGSWVSYNVDLCFGLGCSGEGCDVCAADEPRLGAAQPGDPDGAGAHVLLPHRLPREHQLRTQIYCPRHYQRLRNQGNAPDPRLHAPDPAAAHQAVLK